ncbi:O-antigen ligase family protein [Vibrio sp. VPAP30]|uniref:O-antigen ligase family protein n=1 Tax=Vibrio sp. VPAP30 TaxID=1647102 RepID=UPI0006582659|nr:O-antigen ligase family protein [Vibrio sp. VPAP30]KLN65572.1 ligase [Vibrio sp. VPAP30]
MFTQLSYGKSINWIMFLVPALLLTTKNVSIAFIALSILISIVYLYKNWDRLTFSKFDLVVTLCMSFYFLGAIPITVYDGTTARYFQGGIRLLLCLPLYFALRTYRLQGDLQFRRSLELGVLVGSIGTFILACYQYLILGMPRVDGFLFSINFGYLACALSFLGLTLSFKSKLKTLLLIGSALSSIAVIFTFTRGAIFTIPILLVILALFNLKQIKKRYIMGGIVAFFLVVFTLYKASTDFKNRIDYTSHELALIYSGQVGESTSSGYRLQYWQGAIEAFKASPVIGLPYKQREEINHQLFLEGTISKGASTITRGHAHNQYFEMLATNGLLGLFSIFGVFIIPFIIFSSHYFKIKSNWSLSAAIFVCGFAIFGLTEVPLTANLIGSFYGFMLAVFFAIIASEKRNKSVY